MGRDPELQAGELSASSETLLTAAFTPEGRTLATGDAAGAVRLWDLSQGVEGAGEPGPRVLRAHSGAVRAVAFSPAGDVLATGGDDGAVCLWDGRTGRLIRTLMGHHRGVHALAFLPPPPHGDVREGLVTGGGDGVVRLWHYPTGKCLWGLGNVSGNVEDLAFSPDGRVLASAHPDRAARLWNPRTGELIRILTGFEQSLYSVAFSPDSGVVAAGGGLVLEELRVWNLKTGVFSGTPGEASARLTRWPSAPTALCWRWGATAGHAFTTPGVGNSNAHSPGTASG